VKPSRAAQFERLFAYFVLIATALGGIFPIYWTLNTSLKLETKNVTFPPQWLPEPVTLEHYAYVLQSALPRNYLNSVLLAAGTIVLVLLVAVHASYAAARFQFRGKNIILFVLLATTWILRGFFESIPADLEESAMVDGCTQLGAFYRIILPLAQPGLVAAAILVFVWVWNEFVIALNLTSSNNIRPLTVGLYFFVSESGIEWGRMAAAASIPLIPVIILFAFLQRRFIQGLTAGAVRG